jgi:replicative DNA helicase
MITINPSIRQPNECKDVELRQVLSHFKNKDNHNIDKLRAESDKDAQNKMKMDLPVVIFGGTFSTRSNKGLKQASGLMILDFDCESQAESDKILSIIKSDEYIHAYFKSTRGLGWKALVRIPVVKNDEEYKLYWNAIEEHFPNVDSACKDISRACFYSYDPELVYKAKSKIWDKKKNPNIQRASQKISKNTNYTLVNKALNVIRKANEGERHTKILNASRLCGGWVASGKVDYQEAQRLLEQEAYHIDPKDFATNKKAIVDGLEHGMRSPLDDEKYFAQQSVEEKFDKIYWTASDVEDEIESKFEIGIEGGYKTGYAELDEIYSMHLGYTTYIYGAPFSGKSQVWYDLLKNMSFKYGLKHAVYSPETGDASDIIITLIEMVAGADFYNTYGNKMSHEKMIEARKFVDEHFIVIDPAMESMTVDEMIASVELIERVYNTKIHTLTIDPWNDLYHDMKEQNYREDKYLEVFLKKLRVTAKFNNWHICVVTHVQDQQKERQGTVQYYPPATFREIAGGQTWSRRGFMMSSIWRPPTGLNEFRDIPLQGNETFWLQQKYKPQWAGSAGFAILRYDSKRHCYYTGKLGLEKYANLKKETTTSGLYSDEAPF